MTDPARVIELLESIDSKLNKIILDRHSKGESRRQVSKWIWGLVGVGVALLILAVVALGLGVIGAREESSTTVISYAKVSCGSFSSREAAQAFYDAVQDLDYKYDYFDRDKDGIACEAGVDYYHPDDGKDGILPERGPTPSSKPIRRVIDASTLLLPTSQTWDDRCAILVLRESHGRINAEDRAMCGEYERAKWSPTTR